MASHLYKDEQNTQFMNQFSAFQQNPIQFLTQRRINIPQQYQNNPHEAVQYLLNSGQMSQDRLNQLMRMANQMGIKI